MTWPGENLLIKLWETLAEKGIGGLLKPWQIRREALAHIDVKRVEIVALADAEREAEEIRSGRMKLSESRIALALPSPDSKQSETKRGERSLESKPIVEVCTANLVADAIRREVNVARALIYTESELKDDPQKPPDRDIDGDWLYRWRDYAGAVSSEELQSLWGRLLAGELKSPGSYSYRTMEFVRNLSTVEAQQIAHLSRFVIVDFIARNQMTVLEEEGISFGMLLSMQALGVLSGVEALGLAMTFKSEASDRFVKALCSHGRVLIITHEDSKMEIRLRALVVTSIGCELMRLGKFEPHEGYLKAVGEEIKKTGAVKVSIANYQNVSGNKIRTFDEQPL